MNNPLLEAGALPAFHKIEPQHIKPAMAQIIAENRQAIDLLLDKKEPRWHNLVDPLALLEDRLSKSWSPVRHMNSVKSSESLREAYDQCLPLLSEYATELGHNRRLYEAFKHIAEADDYAELDGVQQKAILDALKHFRLSGVGLEGKARQSYQDLQKDLSALQSSFANNLLDASQSWELVFVDKTELDGLPDYALSMLQQLAAQKDKTGYRITLDMPCYIAVITYADNRALRKEIYQAFVTRASAQGLTDKKWDNTQNMVDILAKRQEKARLLGFANYAEYSLETKMADSAEQVIEFLFDLAEHSKSTALQEVAERQAYAASLGFEGELEAWDYAYYSEKLKQQCYKISDADLKPYFSDKLVIRGLFDIVKKLYGVEISQLKDIIEVWDESVSFYQIQNQNGIVIGHFYLDLYARENKRGGAWMDECINRYRINNKTQIPVAYLTCNLTPPLGTKPALFTHDEVITLFHEFGHGLHHLLTQVDVPDLAGVNGVEWDAVELPSQFMENFCWQQEALQLFARHYLSAEVLPEKLFKKMTAAKNFQSGLQMLRQIEFALFDIILHQQATINTAPQIQQILDQVREQVSVVKTPAFNKFQHGFSHIFAGGYAAGYYSYKWAEVLSADAFAAFEEEGIFNSDTGRRFQSCILETGGSRPAMDSFHCFRGRLPTIEALLRHNGITS